MELYKKVRLACAEGMSARAAAKHFNISRGTVEKMLSFSVPPGYRREKPIKRPKLDGFEPRRVCRRLISVSYAAMASVSRAA